MDRMHANFGVSLLRFLWWAVSVVALGACLDYIMQGCRQLADHRQGSGRS